MNFVARSDALYNLHHRSPSSSRFPFPQRNKNRPQDQWVLCVGGCTTGSVCPIGAHIWGAEFLAATYNQSFVFLKKKHNKANRQSLCSCAPKPCQNALNTEILAH